MPHTTTWDGAYEAVPADTDLANTLGDVIRDLKRDIRERAEIDHDWDDVTNAGQHKKVSLQEQAADPATVANLGYVYSKDVAGITELFYMDSAGTVKQITTNGKLSGTVDSLITARGDWIRGSAGNVAEKQAKGAAGTVLQFDANDLIAAPLAAANVSVASAVAPLAGANVEAVLDSAGTELAKIQGASSGGTLGAVATGATTWAHGLGVIPSRAILKLQCINNEQDYVTGDIVIPPMGGGDLTGFTGDWFIVSLFLNSINVVVGYNQSNTRLRINRKDGASQFEITHANWRFVIEAWI